MAMFILREKAELIPEKFPYCCMTQIENSGDGKTSIGNKPTLWKQGYEWQLASNKISGALDELENIEKNNYGIHAKHGL